MKFIFEFYKYSFGIFFKLIADVVCICSQVKSLFANTIHLLLIFSILITSCVMKFISSFLHFFRDFLSILNNHFQDRTKHHYQKKS